jgi:hypothetical protein
MPPIRNTISRLTERIIAETRASIISRHPTPILRRLYVRTPLVSAIPLFGFHLLMDHALIY